MGSGASMIKADEAVSIEIAEVACGSAWTPELAAQFEKYADPETKMMSPELVAKFILEDEMFAAIPGRKVEGGSLRPKTRMLMKVLAALSLSNGFNSKTGMPTSKWLFLKAKSRLKALPTISRKDLMDDRVGLMMLYIDGLPQLSDQNLDDKIKTAAMSPEQQQDLATKRRERLRMEASKQTAKFEALSIVEKKSALEDGDLDLYSPENLAKREAMYSDDMMIDSWLEKWWQSFETYFDRDHSDTLSREEYAKFYPKLLRILEKDPESGVGELSVAEKEAMMEQDFQADAGEDGQIDKEEFRYAVFQLADHWTLTCDVSEYVKFLEHGYEAIFRDIEREDRPVLPKSWKKEIKMIKSLATPPEITIVDLMASILSDLVKLLKAAKETHAHDAFHNGAAATPATRAEPREKVDKRDFQHQSTLLSKWTLESFTMDWFKNKYGSGKPAKKHFKAFTSGLLHLIGDEKSVYQDFALLYAQIAGVRTPLSCRITPLPVAAGEKVLLHLDAVKGLVEEMRHRAESVQELKRVGGEAAVEGLAVGTPNARITGLVSGFIETEKAEAYLIRHVLPELMSYKQKKGGGGREEDGNGIGGPDEDDALKKVTILSLWSLSTETRSIIDHAKKTGQYQQTFHVVQCMAFTVLLGVIYAAAQGAVEMSEAASELDRCTSGAASGFHVGATERASEILQPVERMTKKMKYRRRVKK